MLIGSCIKSPTAKAANTKNFFQLTVMFLMETLVPPPACTTTKDTDTLGVGQNCLTISSAVSRSVGCLSFFHAGRDTRSHFSKNVFISPESTISSISAPRVLAANVLTALFHSVRFSSSLTMRCLFSVLHASACTIRLPHPSSSRRSATTRRRWPRVGTRDLTCATRPAPSAAVRSRARHSRCGTRARTIEGRGRAS